MSRTLARTLFLGVVGAGWAWAGPSTVDLPAKNVETQAITAQSQDVRQELADSLWKSAAALYLTESEDYIRTLSETLDDLRYWRQKILQEKYDKKIAQVEDILERSNGEVLSQIEKYVSSYGIENLDDTLMMRMAQLNYEKANFDFNTQMRQYDTHLLEFRLGKRKTPPEPPSPHYKRVIFFTTQLIQRFQASLLGDKAQYLLGYCLFEEGKGEEAVKVYAELVKNHPYSELAPEAKWRQAEYYFDLSEYEKALSLYTSLAESRNGFSSKALYKEGAVLFQMGKYERSAIVFAKLFKETSSRDTSEPEVGTLYDESLDYLAHLKAKGLNLKFDEDIDASITEKLAQAYHKIHDPEGERGTYLEFVRSRPFSRAAPKFMDEVIEGYDNDDEKAKAQEVRNKLVLGLGSDSPYWVKHQFDVATVLDTQDLYEKHVLASAQFYADQAKRTKRKADYEAAARFFKSFLDGFPASPLVPEARYELAELEYFSTKYAEAAATYWAVVADPASESYREEAAYGYLLSEIKLLKFDLSDDQAMKAQRLPSGELAEPSALSVKEEQVVRALDFYADNAVKGGRKHRVLYKLAEIFFHHNQFDKARKFVEKIIGDRQQTEITASAARLNTLIYDLQNNWDKLIETHKRRLQLVTSVDSEGVSSEITGVGNMPILAQASKFEALQSWPEAASEYQRFATEYPKSPEAPGALLKAGRFYKEIGQIANSNLMLEKLVKGYPKNELGRVAEFLKIGNKVSVLQFEEAANLYEVFGKKYSKERLGSQAYLNAATLRRGMSSYRAASNDFTKYAATVNDDEVWLEAIEYLSEAGAQKEAAKILAKYTGSGVDPSMRVRASFGLAKLAWPQSAKYCRDIQGLLEKYSKTLSAQARHAAAGCIYLQSTSIRDDVLAFKFSAEDLKNNLAVFESRMADLAKKYSVVQTTQDKVWTTHALIDNAFVLAKTAEKIMGLKPDLAKTLKEKALTSVTKAFEFVPMIQFAQILEADCLDRFRNLTSANLLSDDRVWPVFSLTTDWLTVPWASNDDSALKISFEQEHWGEVERLAQKNLNYPFAYLALARAQISRAKWLQARDTLFDCSKKFEDLSCIADLFYLGYHGELYSKYLGMLSVAVKGESRLEWKLSLARTLQREGKMRGAFSYAQEAVVENTQAASGYLNMSELLLTTKRYELARIALSEGLRNSGGNDESINIRLGYLNLILGNSLDVQSLVEELQAQNTMSLPARIFVTHVLNASGKTKQAYSMLNENSGSLEAIGLSEAQFSLVLLHREGAKADELSKTLMQKAPESPYSNYLLGLYFENSKDDQKEAAAHFSRAYDLGEWRARLSRPQTRGPAASSSSPKEAHHD